MKDEELKALEKAFEEHDSQNDDPRLSDEYFAKELLKLDEEDRASDAARSKVQVRVDLGSKETVSRPIKEFFDPKSSVINYYTKKESDYALKEKQNSSRIHTGGGLEEVEQDNKSNHIDQKEIKKPINSQNDDPRLWDEYFAKELLKLDEEDRASDAARSKVKVRVDLGSKETVSRPIKEFFDPKSSVINSYTEKESEYALKEKQNSSRIHTGGGAEEAEQDNKSDHIDQKETKKPKIGRWEHLKQSVKAFFSKILSMVKSCIYVISYGKGNETKSTHLGSKANYPMSDLPTHQSESTMGNKHSNHK
ncbi:hypothetical protein OAT84_00050 [Gammaproteobacteria bacterium]|nr:hypothetical protein [Gammaproteobacteria bacterium]